jgi:CBS domain-containing protein
LLPRARRANDALARCGFPLCAGNIMAGNPAWCLSLDEWDRHFAGWIENGDPQGLLHSSIFFDFRPIHGERAMADTLRRRLLARVARSPRFLHQMAANALRNRPPLGLLGDFATSGKGGQHSTIDLKLNGAMLFVDAARVYGLAAGVAQTSTCDRLREYARCQNVAPLELQAWVDGFLFLQVLRLRQQHAQNDAGEPLGNRINPAHLNELESRVLKEALRQARRLQSRLALDYGL